MIYYQAFSSSPSDIMVTLKDQNQATIYTGNSINSAGVNTFAMSLGTFTNPITLEITNSSNNQTFEIDNITLTQDGIEGVSYYTAQLVSAQDYYPFGTTLPGRTFQDDRFSGYRFSFNGMEKDNETYGEGNAYDFGARIYDSRLGRWLSVDPLTKQYPDQSPYCFALNNPIILIDPTGGEVVPTDALTTSMGAIWNSISPNSIIKKYSGGNSVNIIIDYKPITEARGVAIGGMLIKLNSNFYNSSSDQTIVLKTVVHELIHAKLSRQLEAMTTLNSEGNRAWKSNASSLYPGLVDYIKQFGFNDDKKVEENGSTRNWQHNWMADFGRKDIISAMKESDFVQKVDRSTKEFSANQWYEAISFSGLEGTKAWNSLSKETQTLYSKIIRKADSDVLTNLREIVIKPKQDSIQKDTL